jgi:DNA repair exonuclease SbcCD ATPase subunit
MNQEQYKEKLRNQLKELTDKLDQLKHQVVDTSLKDEYESHIQKMEQIIQKMGEQYEQTEQSVDEKWDKLNTNMYRDVESFNNAFRKAGALFKPEDRKD